MTLYRHRCFYLQYIYRSNNSKPNCSLFAAARRCCSSAPSHRLPHYAQDRNPGCSSPSPNPPVRTGAGRVGLFTRHFILLQVLLRVGRVGYRELGFENRPPHRGEGGHKALPLRASHRAFASQQSSRSWGASEHKVTGFRRGRICSQREGERLWSAQL